MTTSTRFRVSFNTIAAPALFVFAGYFLHAQSWVNAAIALVVACSMYGTALWDMAKANSERAAPQGATE